MIKTGLFTNRSWDIPERIKYNKEPIMNNYDQWLNSNNPIDLYEHEEERREEEERELLLDNIEYFDTEEEIQEYLSENKLEDPRD